MSDPVHPLRTWLDANPRRSVEGLAAALDVSPATVWAWIRRWSIPNWVVGRRVYIITGLAPDDFVHPNQRKASHG